MCAHDWRFINDVKVCLKCGLTIANGKVIFDRKLPNYKKPKKRKCKRK